MCPCTHTPCRKESFTGEGDKLTAKDGSGRLVDVDPTTIRAGRSSIFLPKSVLLPKQA